MIDENVRLTWNVRIIGEEGISWWRDKLYNIVIYYWGIVSPGSNTPQDTNCTATCPLSRKLFQVRRTRHAGHCWRSRDELIRDVLLWIPTHGRAKAGRPARTYIQQLCEDTGCCPEDLPRAMNDREEWRKRVRDIRAASTIWWWWLGYYVILL